MWSYLTVKTEMKTFNFSFPRFATKSGRFSDWNRRQKQRKHKTMWVWSNCERFVQSYYCFCWTKWLVWSLCASVLKIVTLQNQVQRLQQQLSELEGLRDSEIKREYLQQSDINAPVSRPYTQFTAGYTDLWTDSVQLCLDFLHRTHQSVVFYNCLICLRAQKWSCDEEGRTAGICGWAPPEESDKCQIE